MSRIFIENLPKNVNENELRKRFSQKGEITDIQLKSEKRNAFIGFKTSEQAQEAIDYFNKTFINSCKISVKAAKGFIVNKNINQIVDEPPSKKIKTKKFDPFEELKDDEDFKNFLQVQRNLDSGKGKQIWKDDAINPNNDVLNENENDHDEQEISEDEKETKSEEIVKNSRSKDTFEFTLKIKGLPYKIKKKQLKEFLLPVKARSLRFVPKVKGIAYVSLKTENEMKQILVKHRGFIEGRRVEITRYFDKSNNSTEIKTDEDSKSKVNEKELKKNKWKNSEDVAEPIGESGRIYARNLSYTCTEDDLRQLFEKYGAIAELHMPIDSFTKKPKGFAFITFVFPEHAVVAFNELDKTDFQGRLLHLMPAHGKTSNYNGPPPAAAAENEVEDDNVDSKESKKSSFKDKKKEELKIAANYSSNWNTLFIRPDAIANIMSKKFEVDKTDLLTKSNKQDNVAVRIALGETQIVHEVRQFLIKNKVCLESFSRGQDCPRSKTVILVKNLPMETQESELNDLFSKFGLINRIVLPPYGVSAIIEMQEPNEAKFAFKRLAYSNFKHYPLYLEWAPEDVFNGSFDENDVTEQIVDETVEASVEKIEKKENIVVEDNTTIFVKNLNFKTTEDDFKNHFANVGKVYSATIATKKSSEGLLSMGYGFIQYYKTKDAKEAIKRLQHTVLDEHTLVIKLSNRTINQPTEVLNSGMNNKKNGQQKQNGTKICVKNIPFEATIKDIQKIFSVYGQIKSVRLPKKLSGTSSFRGFGFVDFVTKDDAKRAFDVLAHSTHLYGRPLVLEWAKDDSNTNDSLDNNEVRQVGAKMARYFGNSSNGHSMSKRLKKSDLVDELERSSSSKIGQHDDHDLDGE